MSSFNSYIQNLHPETLIQIIISNPRKSSNLYLRHVVTPYLSKEERHYHIESFTTTQAFHENLAFSQLLERLIEVAADYKQFNIFCENEDLQILVNKKGDALAKKLPPSKQLKLEKGHNKEKNYILREGTPVDFLVYLGVMSDAGHVHKKMQDKFRQINRYLEMIDDVLSYLPTDRPLHIIDFGCGKSYLTFALYYYLNTHKKREAHITGLDLKDQVIRDCQNISNTLGYEHLTFQHGDIASFNAINPVDMVVTLHACDIATDFALKKAVLWQAQVIMSVPCCQHELNTQIKLPDFENLLKYGIIKERVSSLLTDAIRGNWLEAKGYSVQLLEFIDMAHTPKNILIRAYRKSKNDSLEVISEETSNESLLKLHDLVHQLNASLEILR
jgi:SAM-dependent methyltransferase